MLAYRADIDGLRAVAVLAVVLYHAGLPGFAGGYVGVDVFFVISGFLITALVLRERAEGRFSFRAFYERRVRRIVPPLFVMLALCWLAGLGLLLPGELRLLAVHVQKAVLLSLNFSLAGVTYGYFAPAADGWPLLHLWSLCVEEQFYLVFPPLLVLAHARCRAWLAPLLGVLWVVSFGLAIERVAAGDAGAFFLPQARAWEFLTGALCAMPGLPRIEAPGLRAGAATLGALMLAASVVVYSEHTPFPGGHALLPCLGAAALLHAGASGASFVTRVLEQRALVAIGKVSYGLYLWHWPLLALARNAAPHPLEPQHVAALVGLSGLLSVLSLGWIEAPLRTGRVLPRRRALFGVALSCCAGLVVAAQITRRTDGLPGRLSSRALAYAQAPRRNPLEVMLGHCREPRSERNEYIRCVTGAAGARPNFTLWGDSHAGMLVSAFARLAAAHGRAGLVAVGAGCPPLLGVEPPEGTDGRCAEFLRGTLARLAAPELSHVVLAARWDRWRHGSAEIRTVPPQLLRTGLVRTVEALAASGKRITIVAPIPEPGITPWSALARLTWWRSSRDIRPRVADFSSRHRALFVLLDELRRRHRIDVVYPHRALCDVQRCAVESPEGLLYEDSNHLTELGALRLVPSFELLFR